MTTAAINDGYGGFTFPLTTQDTDSTSAYSRIETPRWSPDGTKIIFSGGMDVDGGGFGAGTEIYTMDFDTTGLASGTMKLDNNIQRITYTSLSEGDPISGVVNTSPVYSNDGGTVYFVSTRRAPTTTLHDRNIWTVPANGMLEPQIYYFTRSDDVDPFVMPDGRLLFSSALGFPTEMLVRLEEEIYQDLAENNDEGVDEVQLRALAAEEVQKLQFFEGVMSHIYYFNR